MPASCNRNRRTATRAGPFSGEHTAVRNMRMLHKENQQWETSNIADKVVVITGASSGLGASTAKLLARHGAKVVLGARRKDRIDAVVQEIAAAGGSAIGFA